MTDKLENKTVETEEVKAAEKTEGKKKKKSRKKKILKRLIWLVIILLVLGVALWSVISKLQAEYRVTYGKLGVRVRTDYLDLNGTIVLSEHFGPDGEITETIRYGEDGDQTAEDEQSAQ